MKNSNLFVDSEFPANINSIFSKGHRDNFSFFTEIEWKRLEDFLPPGHNLIENASSNDIIQGNVGDCWFLASIASIAEHPKILQNIFQTPRVNSQGKYILRFYIDGEERLVTVDSYLPFTESGYLYSARQHHKMYWVALLEKGYAKLIGGYDRLKGGDCEEALRDLTGNPTTTLDNNMPDDQFWKLLQKYGGGKDYLLTCGVDSQELKSGQIIRQLRKMNLLLDHVYTILSARMHPETGTKLLCLRNPWGHMEYMGEWRESSSNWTSELRKFYHKTGEKGGGVFHMSYAEFRRSFNLVSVGFMQENWGVQRLKTSMVKGETSMRIPTLKLSLEKDCQVHLALHQSDERMKGAFGKMDIGAILIDQYNHKAYDILEPKLKRVLQKNVFLRKGEYHILPFSSGILANKSPSTPRPLVVTAHYSSPLKITLSTKGLETNRLEPAFASVLAYNPNVKVYPGPLGLYDVRVLNSRDFMLVGLETNPNSVNSRESRILVEIDCSKSKNIALAFDNPFKKVGTYTFALDTERKMFHLKFVRKGMEEYNFEFNCRMISDNFGGEEQSEGDIIMPLKGALNV